MAGPKINFELEGTATFRSGSGGRGNNVRFPYRRFCTEKVDGLPLIPRSCDLPPPGVQVNFRAHKNRKGTVWCCHIDPADLPDGCSLAGRYFHEELVERNDIKPSQNDDSIGFAPKCHFNGGPLLHVNRDVKPANGKYWYRPSGHLVWFVSANQLEEGQITLLESDTGEGENPLMVWVNGEERGVYVVLGFIEVDPKAPPRPQEVRRAYSLMLDATKDSSGAVLKVLVAGGHITVTQATRMQGDASERRYTLIQAYRKAYAYSVSKYGPEKRDDRVSFTTPTIFAELVQRAAQKVKRTPREDKGGRTNRRTAAPSKPGSDIPVAEVLAAVAKKHFPERPRQGHNDFIGPLNQAGYTNAADLATANSNDLAKVLKNQGRTQAVIDAAKALISNRRQAVAASTSAVDVEA